MTSQEIRRNETLGAHILGSPIGDPIKSQQYVAKRVSKIVKDLENVKKLNDPQKMLLLLRSCLSLPKFMFVLRSSPPENILPCIKELDEATLKISCQSCLILKLFLIMKIL